MNKQPGGFSLFLLVLVATGSQAEAIDWPQELVADDGSTVLIYQPQVEEFSGNSIEGRAAVSVKTSQNGGIPVFGAIWIHAKIDTDRDARNAIIRDVRVSDVRFADASDAEKQKLAEFIEQHVTGSSFAISVDQLLADLRTDADGARESALKHDAPNILLSSKPAILISIDGEPVYEVIDGSMYERVVNSAFLIVRGGRDLYLYIGSNQWYRAEQIEEGWSRTNQVPKEVAGMVEPADGDGEDVGEIDIIVVTEATELLLIDGNPTWSPIEGMDLLYMDNTDSSVFLELSTQSYYLLMSGRWYRGDGVVGDLKWEHVPNDELPEPFSDIPEDSVNGAVLSQVAGTSQARQAVLDNTIPQTAAIDRGDTSFAVEYDGAPDFAPIEEISVEYAQNTTAAVFRYGPLYYACDDGVWYVSNSATGGWVVATEVPDAIYKIPLSNPHHNVTYVKVYDVTPEVVYVGYTPGYYGSYYYRGSVIYGTGWRYHPWYGPYYYPRHPTWGFHVSYNPWYGWGVGVSWTNGPFRFTYSGHGSWWGVGGYRPYPRPVPYGGYRKTNININNNINLNGRNRPETRPNVYNRPANVARNVERPATPANRQARPAGNVRNDVLTDRSGNVYQRTPTGDWRQRESGNWSKPQNMDRSSATTRPYAPQAPTTRPSTAFDSRPATRPQLERDYNARQQGARRAQSFDRQRPRRRR